MILHRAGIIDPTMSAYLLPLSITATQEGRDLPKGEGVGWLGLGIALTAHLANTDGAPVKYQALGRDLQTLDSWSARLGQEELLRPCPTPYLPGCRVGER